MRTASKTPTAGDAHVSTAPRRSGPSGNHDDEELWVISDLGIPVFQIPGLAIYQRIPAQVQLRGCRRTAGGGIPENQQPASSRYQVAPPPARAGSKREQSPAGGRGTTDHFQNNLKIPFRPFQAKVSLLLTFDPWGFYDTDDIIECS